MSACRHVWITVSADGRIKEIEMPLDIGELSKEQIESRVLECIATHEDAMRNKLAAERKMKDAISEIEQLMPSLEEKSLTVLDRARDFLRYRGK